MLLEQRQQPVLDGEPGRVVSGVADRVAQGTPGALEEIPVPFGGVLDGPDADDVVVRGRDPETSLPSAMRISMSAGSSPPTVRTDVSTWLLAVAGISDRSPDRR